MTGPDRRRGTLPQFGPSGHSSNGGRHPWRVHARLTCLLLGQADEEVSIKTLEDRMTSLVLLIVSCLIMIESVRLKIDQFQEPGPGFVPFFLGLALAILSVISLIFPYPQKKAVAPSGTIGRRDRALFTSLEDSSFICSSSRRSVSISARSC